MYALSSTVFFKITLCFKIVLTPFWTSFSASNRGLTKTKKIKVLDKTGQHNEVIYLANSDWKCLKIVTSLSASNRRLIKNQKKNVALDLPISVKNTQKLSRK